MLRHVAALVVFIALCLAVALAAGFEGAALVGYVLACIVFAFPLAAAAYAFVGSELGARRYHRAVLRANNEGLPRGVEWVFPAHEPGRCGSPETPPDAMVID